MTRPRPIFVLAFLLAVCLTAATMLEPRYRDATQADNSGGWLKTVLGESRRLFANQFYTKADVYFHSGYYPTFFEQAQRNAVVGRKHLADEANDHDDHDEEEHEKSMDFLGQPKDWIERFGRHFYPSTHSHLDKPGQAKEILPWLRLSAELDPKQVDTFVLGAYWMSKNVGKPDEAEEFLREGLKANPDSYEILYELGLLYLESRHQPIRARNLWEAALRQWQHQEEAGKKPDEAMCDRILANLSRVEEEQGNKAKAISDMQLELKYSPSPDAIKKHIKDLEKNLPEPKGLDK
jgi:tetratricopeptide (TPR) repeat protein